MQSSALQPTIQDGKNAAKSLHCSSASVSLCAKETVKATNQDMMITSTKNESHASNSSNDVQFQNTVANFFVGFVSFYQRFSLILLTVRVYAFVILS
jgi:hypothetical protein